MIKRSQVFVNSASLSEIACSVFGRKEFCRLNADVRWLATRAIEFVNNMWFIQEWNLIFVVGEET